jgi:hypothetical protein
MIFAVNSERAKSGFGRVLKYAKPEAITNTICYYRKSGVKMVGN